MTLRQAALMVALATMIVLGGCVGGVQDVRQDLGRILAARSPLPADERYVLPASHRTMAPAIAAPLVSLQQGTCANGLRPPTLNGGDSIVVQPGDTLSGIARRAYGGYAYAEELARENAIANPDLIHPGQVLRLPALTESCGLERHAAYVHTIAPAPGAGLSRRAFSPPSQRQPELRMVSATADDRERAARRR